MKINPIRSSRVVTSSMVAKQLTKHSSSWQAKGYSASNGINELLLNATKKLKQKGINSAPLDAEVLLSFVLKKPKEFIFLNPEKEVIKNQSEKFFRLLKRRLKLEPIAYLIQKKEFYGLEFYVDKRVLIPRPETEILVEEIIKEIRFRHHKLQATSYPPASSREASRAGKLTVADIGTGSGCIAITLAKFLPKINIIAIDISKKALAVAKKNMFKHQVASRLKLIKGDLLEPLNKKVDLIVANLPYLSFNELNDNLKYEPQNALWGEMGGLKYIRRLLEQAPLKLKKEGKIFLEINPRQVKMIKKYAFTIFPNARIEMIKDLAGWERVIIITI